MRIAVMKLADKHSLHQKGLIDFRTLPSCFTIDISHICIWVAGSRDQESKSRSTRTCS